MLSVILSACNNAGEDLLSLEPLKGEINGKVVDAALVGSTIQVFEWNQGEIASDPLAETTTDINGNYTLEPRYYDDAFLIVKATGGSYIEEATGIQVDLQPGQELTGIVRHKSGDTISLNITVLTHWATCMAEWQSKNQGASNVTAVNLSYDAFSSIAGVAIREVEPLDLTDLNNTTPTLNEGLQYGIYPTAVSSLTKNMSERSGLSPHTLPTTTSIHFAQIGCNDVRADGKLDGLGFDSNDTKISPLGFGSVSLTPRVYRTEIAQHMLTMAKSHLNKTGLQAIDYLSHAQSLSTMDSDIFDNIAPESVDLDGPVISIDLPENALLKGTANLVFAIDDPLDISKVEYYVDDSLVATKFEDNNKFILNTIGYSDGQHEIKVLAYDALDNIGTFLRNYNFDNSGPIVTFNSSTLTNSLTYEATGTYQLEGADLKTILVNGSPATLDILDKTWSSTISLAPGNNTITIQAEDNNANFSAEIIIDVAVDTVPPELRNTNNTSIRTSTGQNQYTACDSGTMAFQNQIALCISDNRVSLNGQPVSVDLLNESYTLITYQVSDTPTDGIFTTADELKIDYKVEKNNSLIQDWKKAPARNTNDTDWFLPLTTEYLGDT